MNGTTLSSTQKNKPLSTLYELRMLMGDNEQFGRVKNYLTVYSPEKAVNINFADELTIKAFIPPNWRSMQSRLSTIRRPKSTKTLLI